MRKKREKFRKMELNKWIPIFKTISYRLIGATTTVVVVYIFTGQLKLSLAIGGIEIVAKMVFYYLHELVWQKIKENLVG